MTEGRPRPADRPEHWGDTGMGQFWRTENDSLFVYWGFRARRLLRLLCAHNVQYVNEFESKMEIGYTRFMRYDQGNK